MISFDFLQFDQTNLWFFVVSALGLIRERRILPFVLVIIANLIHGEMAATLIAGLFFWHQLDRGAAKWIQLKSALGFLMVFMAAVTPEPYQEFAACFGVLLLSLNFGQGGLGVIPAVVLLREYVPHPPFMEVLLGVAAFYWVTLEGLRLLKLKQIDLIAATLETLCTLGILFGLRDLFLKFSDEVVLLSVGAGVLLVTLMIAALVSFRGDAFWRFYRKTKVNLAAGLTVGDRMIDTKVAWLKVHNEEIPSGAEVERSLDRLFVLAILAAALLAAFCFVSRGGMS
jgi:hypothetical protein